jgi:hypothetical protein
MSVPLGPNAISECIRRSAEARHLAAACRNPAQKADLLDVAQTWRALAGRHEGKPEYEQLKKAVGWG